MHKISKREAKTSTLNRCHVVVLKHDEREPGRGGAGDGKRKFEGRDDSYLWLCNKRFITLASNSTPCDGVSENFCRPFG